MTDRFVIKTWWILTLTLVAGTAIGCVMTAYCGMSNLFALKWSAAGSCTVASILLGGSAYLLCRYRGDLVGD